MELCKNKSDEPKEWSFSLRKFHMPHKKSISIWKPMIRMTITFSNTLKTVWKYMYTCIIQQSIVILTNMFWFSLTRVGGGSGRGVRHYLDILRLLPGGLAGLWVRIVDTPISSLVLHPHFLFFLSVLSSRRLSKGKKECHLRTEKSSEAGQ